MPSPDRHSLELFRKFLRDGGPIIGPDRDAWNDKADLTVIRQFEGRDVFSQWVIRTLIPLLHEFGGKHFKVSMLYHLIRTGCSSG